ncbi:MAG: hypothetical protein ABI197_02465 [Granulicella sp.]
MQTFAAPFMNLPLNFSASAVTPANILAEPLLGRWINGNGSVRDLARISISTRRGTLIVEAVGTLNTESCDWGAVSGIAYTSSVGSVPAVAFSAQYTFHSSHVILIGHLQGKRLLVETFTQFTDNSGRANLYCVDTLSR